MRFSLCSHRQTYIERRVLKGTDLAVQHFVCAGCGKAWPMMRRTAEEHAAMLARGTPSPLAVTRKAR